MLCLNAQDLDQSGSQQVRGAARKLGVAAPSVHRLVKALETERGMVLIDRSASPLRPTPDASTYVERARQLLVELQGLDASLRDRVWRQAAPSRSLLTAWRCNSCCPLC
ncbi:MAG: LysR family transcriptional regulator [Chitinophagaceae bacterium]|nr:LysR family transcriptional regulator [Rubrivivax sp.]